MGAAADILRLSFFLRLEGAEANRLRRYRAAARLPPERRPGGRADGRKPRARPGTHRVRSHAVGGERPAPAGRAPLPSERVWKGITQRAFQRDSLINKPVRTDSLYGPAITQRCV